MDAQERRKKQQREVDANYEVFREKLPDLLGQHAGKYALMKNREVVEFFDSDKDAWAAGKLLYKDDVFSVQLVGGRLIKLGWMGYALFHRAHSYDVLLGIDFISQGALHVSGRQFTFCT